MSQMDGGQTMPISVLQLKVDGFVSVFIEDIYRVSAFVDETRAQVKNIECVHQQPAGFLPVSRAQLGLPIGVDAQVVDKADIGLNFL